MNSKAIEIKRKNGGGFLKKGNVNKDEFAQEILNRFSVKIEPCDCEYIRCRWVWRTNKDKSRTNYIIKNPEGASLNGTFPAIIWRSK